MTLVKQKVKKRVKELGTAQVQLSTKRKQAIEKAISFWKQHAVDMSNFKFDREEANAR